MQTNKDISDMSCIKFNNTKLGGYWDANFLNYIQIIFSPCKNTTENGNSCLNPYLAAQILDSQLISFNIYTNVYYTDLNDYDNPLKSLLSNIYSYVDTESSKNMKLFYKLANISTDLNYIVQDPKQYSIFGVDNFLNDILKVNPSFENATDDTNIALMEIYFSNNIETFNVTYLKLQEILATLGGILNFLVIILKNVSSSINIHYRNLEIFNELFDFNELKNEDKLNAKIEENLSSKKIKMTKKNNTISPLTIQVNNIPRDKEIIDKNDPHLLNYRYRDEISNISIENSKNQLFYNDVNNKGN